MSDARDPVALAARLRAAGCVFAEDEAALLLAEDGDDAALDAMVARRCAGEPLETVLGWARFAGLRVHVEPGVFVPRTRTELLVDLVDELLADGPDDALVVDLCCGTGAVGAAVAARHPAAQVHAADVDPAAVACARHNLRPPDRVHAGDLLSALPASLRGRVDVVVANAPYVPTAAIATMPPEARDHEARVALDGGEDGLAVHRRIAEQVRPWLKVGGAVLVETSERQAPTTATLLAAQGLAVRVHRDDERDGTAVVGRLAEDGLS
ncbi:MAG: putative protein N(5)-glutamine methyltransferase [Cellulomonas sp.]|uniref:putative protein N(5)-glutamine methyltransferase n=1 Tax=Cellulomonas sp. TaxID=40001 RepID=UPI0025896246|nr:putative protein N(5)-glutamine methyltransferase [Cellulomonas sp.]MCR6703356.1 putative protein N(5)-glutamine methyltransferase [Cellulomonas sp.]